MPFFGKNEERDVVLGDVPVKNEVDESHEDEVKTGVEDFSVEAVDGGKAYFKLGDEVRLVDQADLHRASKQIAAGVQVTY